MEALISVLHRDGATLSGQTFFAPDSLCLSLAARAAQSSRVVGVTVESNGETWRWARMGYDHVFSRNPSYTHVSLFDW